MQTSCTAKTGLHKPLEQFSCHSPCLISPRERFPWLKLVAVICSLQICLNLFVMNEALWVYVSGKIHHNSEKERRHTKLIGNILHHEIEPCLGILPQSIHHRRIFMRRYPIFRQYFRHLRRLCNQFPHLHHTHTHTHTKLCPISCYKWCESTLIKKNTEIEN